MVIMILLTILELSLCRHKCKKNICWSYFPSNVQIFYHILDGIRCIAFKPDDDTIFLVGTDEGLVYKCTTEYSSKFLNTYQAHDTPVYNIVWNTYVPSIFMTSGAEWHVKIWDHQIKYDYLYCLQITSTYKIFRCISNI